MNISSARPARIAAVSFILVLFGVSCFLPSKINTVDKLSYKQKDMINIGKGGIFFITDSSFCAFNFEDLQHFDFTQKEKVSVRETTNGTYKLFGEHLFFPFTISPSEEQYDLYLVQTPSASYVDVTPINYQPLRLITTLPEVLVNTIIRPYPWDPGSSLKWFSIFNNLLLLGLLAGLFVYRKVIPDTMKYFRTYLLISAIFILLMIGWTIPILGALVRYKMVVELILILIVFISLKPFRYVKNSNV